MRSEERAGIVSLVLLFLWGTIITAPLHSFMDIFTSVINTILELSGRNTMGKVGAGIFLATILALIISSLFLSKTRLVVYIPISYFGICTLIYVIRAIKDKEYDLKTVVALGAILLIFAVFYILKLDTALVWAADVCIYAPAVFILTALVFIPFRLLLGSFGKFLYITKFQSTNLAAPFDGFLNLPSVIWGIFFAVIIVLPIIYFSFSRRKA